METLDTRSLEEKVDHLIRICNRLADENRALRDQQSSLIAERAALVEKSELARATTAMSDRHARDQAAERAALVEKSELARSRVEAMITRLRAMEVGS